ncbi:phenylalanine--tRNA ligase subunit beta [Lysobacter soyae]|uniref:Phenylalanine--tRNA ligase beta subunit n=1 Tax=Lysobacter soyae TaxID=2764185 RepID=A0ABX8WS15_9GAMM|nr:phenylalanine--tRNA ligase subunit beta [Lysobacter sp. CJ11]QYR53616.1 phenylalanine--tRNA ligase subunit beta [Lysobacter sp. CJ11]
MKFSENWLRELVPDLPASEQLEHQLTMIGLEVEGSETLGVGLDHVVVGQIVACARHPEADRLQICKVDAGEHGTLQIVCGAPNARQGLKAPLAMVGAQIGELKIKPAKLRGVESNGMLCSAKELGLDADASGLLELPGDAPVGAALVDYLGLPDRVIELGLTPNRADCFCVQGIAADIAAANGVHLSQEVQAQVGPAIDSTLQVKLEAGAAAPRYAGRVIEGVDPDAITPLWLAERLRRSGIRPVSFLVDVTQYVMLDLGQPMHAFDRDLLKGPVGVRLARKGEQVKLLDGREAALDDDLLVITDADRPVALAGIMGGADTRVTDATRNVFLEAAHFAPEAIIGKSRRFGLHTDASHRFERGVDPHLPAIAIERATQLIMDHAGGKPGPVVVETLDVHLPQRSAVSLRRARLDRVLGVQVPSADVERILSALGMTVETTADGWLATPPSRRFDIAIEDDLIEEVARIHGYDRIPTTLPAAGAHIHAPTETRITAQALRAHMVARDWQEALCFAFVDLPLLERWGLADNHVALANPLSAELGIMRTGLLPGLAQTLAYNVARQQNRVRLFELGNVFHANGNDAPIENAHFAAVATGDAMAEQWASGARAFDIFDIKGEVEALAAMAQCTLEFVASAPAHAHPGRSADVLRDGKKIGWVGQLHPRLQKQLDVDTPVFAFELDVNALVQRKVPRAETLSKFPAVRRDLAFVVGEDVSWAKISEAVRAAAGESLKSLLLFDRYSGKGIEEGSKSLAMGLILQDNSRTLTDQVANDVMQAVTERLSHDFGAVIRS